MLTCMWEILQCRVRVEENAVQNEPKEPFYQGKIYQGKTDLPKKTQFSPRKNLPRKFPVKKNKERKDRVGA